MVKNCKAKTFIVTILLLLTACLYLAGGAVQYASGFSFLTLISHQLFAMPSSVSVLTMITYAQDKTSTRLFSIRAMSMRNTLANGSRIQLMGRCMHNRSF